nr:MAG TPA: hypothetical protein [Caudoviricetes sp.]
MPEQGMRRAVHAGTPGRQIASSPESKAGMTTAGHLKCPAFSCSKKRYPYPTHTLS